VVRGRSFVTHSISDEAYPIPAILRVIGCRPKFSQFAITFQPTFCRGREGLACAIGVSRTGVIAKRTGPIWGCWEYRREHVSRGVALCSGDELVSLGFRVGNPSAIRWHQANFRASLLSVGVIRCALDAWGMASSTDRIDASRNVARCHSRPNALQRDRENGSFHARSDAGRYRCSVLERWDS
jgi:hypothetical protein